MDVQFPPRYPLALGLALMLVSHSAPAEEVDFSCVEESVIAKTMITPRYQEFDVTLLNDCPGPVNWTMCIETMDPFTHRVKETLTPSGRLEKDKKFRINLQMQKMQEDQTRLSGYEEFYVNTVFDIDGVKKPSCVATRCEQQKKGVREQIRSNKRARQRAEAEINDRKGRECPKGGWGERQQEECFAKIERDSADRIKELRDRERELKAELAEINPETCELHVAQ